ncbi:D-alanine--poly(phosphoribitol) ligase subunit DltA [Ectobacillus sp. sgz5001026]|uniref:D-alanine--poly(phosphoribitol) ligase subunit DltA n=1 Tax=Ectobacillus sp. sgz5001026 TaxID=3242473 RepID=UPI0036D25238
MNVFEEIEHWAQTEPSRNAFVWRDKPITYGQLKEQSDALSYWIAEHDKDAAPIIVYGHMQPEMIVMFLACVKAGHAYIPIDYSIPVDRIHHIVTNSGAKLFLSAADTIISNVAIQTVQKEEMKTIFSTYKGKAANPSLQVTEEDTFYIIYTSGSTGNPKGVQITLGNLQSFVSWMQSDFPIAKNQVFLNQAPFSFDLSVMDLYSSLTTGGTLWAVDKDMIAKPKELFSSFKNSQMEVWTSTPSFAQICLMEPDFTEEMLPNMRTFLFCGEVLSSDTARKLKERFPKASIINTYGPTETTVAVTSLEITDDILSKYTALPVGYCKSDSRILIMKEDGTEAVEEEKGEIIIIGPGVSTGYLGSPNLTNKFFTIIGSKRAYKTGDAGHMQNGLLFFHGRLDFQIKLHGYRMELEEIEHQLRTSSYVEAAVIIPVKKGETYDHLLAVVIPKKHMFEKEYQLTSAIKKEIASFLPNYMIPRKFMYRESIPMTANGKVDRKKLLSEVTA